MDKVRRIQATWRWPVLLGLHLLALLLLGSWLWPTSRAVWDQADLQVFQWLNGSLNHLPLWDWLWALMSLRVFDILVGALMLSLLIHRDWLFRQQELRPALFIFIALLLMLLVVRVLFTKVAVSLGWQHASPSLVVPGAIRLSEQFPLLEKVFELKDRSSRSFPGDHASVLLLWSLFLAVFARGWRLAVVLGLATLFMLPRLVAGAHWLSDDLVGGLLIALLTLAWGYCTPAAAHLAALLQWLTRPAFALARQIPGLKQWALFQSR